MIERLILTIFKFKSADDDEMTTVHVPISRLKALVPETWKAAEHSWLQVAAVATGKLPLDSTKAPFCSLSVSERVTELFIL